MVQDCYKKDAKAVHIDTTAVLRKYATNIIGPLTEQQFSDTDMF